MKATKNLISSTVIKILREKLSMKKLSTRWVPFLLTAENKRNHVTDSMAGLALFRHNPSEFLSRYITVDETWIHFHTPETKEHSKKWTVSDEPGFSRCERNHLHWLLEKRTKGEWVPIWKSRKFYFIETMHACTPVLLQWRNCTNGNSNYCRTHTFDEFRPQWLLPISKHEKIAGRGRIWAKQGRQEL